MVLGVVLGVAAEEGRGAYKRWRRDRFTRRALKEYKRLVDERFSYLIGREYVYTADDGAVTQWRVIEPIAYSYGLGVRLQAVDDAKQEQSPYIWPIDPVEAEATQKDWPMGGVRQDPDPHWRRADHADCEAAEVGRAADRPPTIRSASRPLWEVGRTRSVLFDTGRNCSPTVSGTGPQLHPTEVLRLLVEHDHHDAEHVPVETHDGQPFTH